MTAAAAATTDRPTDPPGGDTLRKSGGNARPERTQVASGRERDGGPKRDNEERPWTVLSYIKRVNERCRIGVTIFINIIITRHCGQSCILHVREKIHDEKTSRVRRRQRQWRGWGRRNGGWDCAEGVRKRPGKQPRPLTTPPATFCRKPELPKFDGERDDNTSTRRRVWKETREPKQSRRNGKNDGFFEWPGRHARASSVEAENGVPAGDGVARTGRPRSEFGG